MHITILGAGAVGGAVGGTIGAFLHRAGRPVTLVASGGSPSPTTPPASPARLEPLFTMLAAHGRPDRATPHVRPSSRAATAVAEPAIAADRTVPQKTSARS